MSAIVDDIRAVCVKHYNERYKKLESELEKHKKIIEESHDFEEIRSHMDAYDAVSIQLWKLKDLFTSAAIYRNENFGGFVSFIGGDFMHEDGSDGNSSYVRINLDTSI